jgi:WD40 repeat protein
MPYFQEVFMIESFTNSKVLFTLPWNTAGINGVAFIGNDKLAAANKKGDILIWNLTAPDGKTPDPVRLLVGHTNEINRILVTPDGKNLISASSDHTVKYWNLLNDQGEPGSVVLNDGFVPRGVVEKVEKVPTPPPPIQVKVVLQKPIHNLTNHKEWVLGLTQTPDGKTLVTGDDKGVIIVWDLPAAKELRRWQATQWIRSLGISPDGKTVAASQHTPFIRFKTGLEDYVPHFHLWDAESGRSKLDLSKEIKEGMSSVAFSPDGKWLAAGHGNTQTEKDQGKIFLIDPTTGKKIRELAGHPVGTNDLAFHPDGKHLFSCGRDQQIKIWALQDGKLVHEFGKFADRGVWINAISISLDGKLLAAADGAGHVLIYSLTT